MSIGEPNDCICGRTVSGPMECPVHKGNEVTIKIPKVDNIRAFVSPEQEAEFRVLYKNHYKEHGFRGLMLCLGEMLSCVKILNEVMVEIANEEKKKLEKDKED